ncbi:hypothetical protein F0562_003233 [Nyssa sinensis]|uniref:Annexin n=1 Tax=Nyssa sinensis TaxID=561372 RepID=A0A5J5BUP9_9ASTE|nr:hypothetical protein F0562_003233 [Nyssa sinensis]
MSSSIQTSRKYELDCQYLNSCFSGNGAVNKQKLVELLTRRNLQELRLIRQTYSTLYNQDLLRVLSNIRINNAFANVVCLRITEPQERDAELVRDALFGWRVNLNTVIEVASTRSSSELHFIKQAYSCRYNSNLEQDIAQKTDGTFKEILLAILKSSGKFGGRVDMSMAMCDAKILYEALESGNSVDWKTIMSLISERNSGQIKAILISYKELYGCEFSKFLKSNKCGKFGKDLRIVIQGIQYPQKFFAKQLRGALQSDAQEIVTRIIITRLGIDIKDISNVFAAKTGWSLGNLVRREFSTAGSGNNTSADKDYGLVAEFLLGLLKHC